MEITLTCEHCGSLFSREKKEYNRSQKLGRKNFCQQGCATSYYKTRRKISPETRAKWGSHIKKFANNRGNELSPFKYFIRKARCADRTTRYGQPDLTLEYLKSLWETQRGTCPYTKHKMILPRNSAEMDQLKSPYRASLDRIDSSIGYVQGNVEFVCLSVNYAKSHFSNEEMKEFFSSINQPKV